MNKYTITYNTESIRRLCFTAERIPSGIEVLFNFWEAFSKSCIPRVSSRDFITLLTLGCVEYRTFAASLNDPRLRTYHKILQLFQIHKISLSHLKKPVSAIILFQTVFLFYNSYISKANVPTTIRSSPVPDFNDSFSWNTIYENAMVTRILSLSIGTTTLAGPV